MAKSKRKRNSDSFDGALNLVKRELRLGNDPTRAISKFKSKHALNAIPSRLQTLGVTTHPHPINKAAPIEA